MHKIRVKPVFLTIGDEKRLSELLSAAYPDLKIIDGLDWPSPEPPLQKSIEKCASWVALLWVGDPSNPLPVIQRNGRYVGPQTKFVIRYVRSSVASGVLTSGQVDASYETDDESMSSFVGDAFKILTKMNSGRIRNSDGRLVKDYVIGPEAMGFEGQIRDRGSDQVMQREKVG